MKTSHNNTLKRKAHDGGEDCQLSLLDEELKNPLVYMGSYLTGKDFSTFLSTALSSREVKDHALRTHLVSAFVAIHKSMTDRCNIFLSTIDAPSAIVTLLKDRSANLKQEIETLQYFMYPNLPRIMRAVSEWSVFLDYCELFPLRLSEARFPQEGSVQPLWIIGAGEFEPTKSPAILSVPSQSWRPELIFLGDKWINNCYWGCEPGSDRQHCFRETIGSLVAVLSLKDGDLLARMNADFADGMVPYQEWPKTEHEIDENGSHTDSGCYNTLYWLPKAYKESTVGEDDRHEIENAECLKWMTKGTEFDNNIIASMTSYDERIPSDHMDGFYDRIAKLLVEIENWL
jgi:hypothetical protein